MAKKTSKKSERSRVQRKPDMAGPSHSGNAHAWTIMVYLAGDNNLSDEMVWAIKEIYRVGAPQDVAVTIQFDPLSANRSTRFFEAPATGARIDVDGIFPILHDDAFPEVDSGNPDTVVDFVLRSSRTAPADHYMLILSGHGAGIVGDFLGDTQAGRLTTNSLGIPDLGKAFRHLRAKLELAGLSQTRGPVIDVLGLDTCLMSMAEICSEVAGEVGYLVGSEGFDPNAGWPYFRILEQLGKRTTRGPLGPAEMARLLVDEYILYYADFADADVSVDISACDVSNERVQPIESAVRQLVDVYLENDSDSLIQNAVVLAHWRAQSYKREQYTDLVDFCSLLREECQKLSKLASGNTPAHALLAKRCKGVVDAVETAAWSDFAGKEFQHSHGLSVYFPWSRGQYEDDYRFSRFAARTRWDQFLERYVDGTRRNKRPRELRSGSPGQRYSDPQQRRVRTDDAGGLTLIRSQVTKPSGTHGSASRRAGARSAAALLLSPGGAVSSATSSLLSQASGLSHRENAPSNRENAPSNRENAPSNRENAPSNRENAPSNRFAQFVGSLMNELPSMMKNPPNDVDPVVSFTNKDLQFVQNFKKTARSAKRKRT